MVTNSLLVYTILFEHTLSKNTWKQHLRVITLSDTNKAFGQWLSTIANTIVNLKWPADNIG